MGQSEDEGFSEGWLLGAVLLDGDSEGIDVGQTVAEGASLTLKLGKDDGIADGCPDKLGDLLGCDVGQSDDEGFLEG